MGCILQKAPRKKAGKLVAFFSLLTRTQLSRYTFLTPYYPWYKSLKRFLVNLEDYFQQENKTIHLEGSGDHFGVQAFKQYLYNSFGRTWGIL